LIVKQLKNDLLFKGIFVCLCLFILGFSNVFEQEKQNIFKKWESNLSVVLSPEQMTSLKKHQAQENAKRQKKN
jgi:hypothetical protein